MELEVEAVGGLSLHQQVCGVFDGRFCALFAEDVVVAEREDDLDMSCEVTGGC